MTTTSRRGILMAVGAAAIVGQIRDAEADTTSYAASDLNGKLTPLGGERAGNSDGTIPAWTGEHAGLPAGFESGDQPPLPFPDDQKSFSITAANIGQYQSKIPDGAVELFNRRQDFRIDVYPTHRTAAAPQNVYDNTFKNATSAQLSADGNSISGAYGGTPFPIPTNGHQVMWNHLLAWRGTMIVLDQLVVIGTSSGQNVLSSRTETTYTFPYYFPTPTDNFNGFYQVFETRITAPPYQAGGATLTMDPVNPEQTPRRVWQYLPGQRRTREAPDLEFDNPNFFSSGVGNFDEFQIFNGSLSDYDCNLIGKKEMYIPYNVNKGWALPASQTVGPYFFNPDFVRWELHRVWIVEMVVKSGKRNVDQRRVLYIDEDSWNAVACDAYDSTGKLWKFSHSRPIVIPDLPCVLGSQDNILYDFHAGVFAATITDSSCRSQWKTVPQRAMSYFSPGQLAALAGGE